MHQAVTHDCVVGHVELVTMVLARLHIVRVLVRVAIGVQPLVHRQILVQLVDLQVDMVLDHSLNALNVHLVVGARKPLLFHSLVHLGGIQMCHTNHPQHVERLVHRAIGVPVRMQMLLSFRAVIQLCTVRSVPVHPSWLSQAIIQMVVRLTRGSDSFHVQLVICVWRV